MFLILSSDQEMIPARNGIDAHVQSFVANDEFLQPFLKAFAQSKILLHASRNAECFQSVCCSRTVCLVY